MSVNTLNSFQIPNSGLLDSTPSTSCGFACSYSKQLRLQITHLTIQTFRESSPIKGISHSIDSQKEPNDEDHQLLFFIEGSSLFSKSLREQADKDQACTFYIEEPLDSTESQKEPTAEDQQSIIPFESIPEFSLSQATLPL
ncbi:MAG TPA: hypothetical protein P5048_01295 [Chlamydiales bacterium]|nr:hypothetical protein [Chlamydiales bacterium]